MLGEADGHELKAEQIFQQAFMREKKKAWPKLIVTFCILFLTFYFLSLIHLLLTNHKK